MCGCVAKGICLYCELDGNDMQTYFKRLKALRVVGVQMNKSSFRTRVFPFDNNRLNICLK